MRLFFRIAVTRRSGGSDMLRGGDESGVIDTYGCWVPGSIAGDAEDEHLDLNDRDPGIVIVEPHVLKPRRLEISLCHSHHPQQAISKYVGTVTTDCTKKYQRSSSSIGMQPFAS